MTAPKTVNPFTFIDAITYSKEDIFDESTEKAYVPFIINRHLSMFKDTVLWANELNMVHHMPKYSQYLFLLNSIPKRKRFAKWNKRVENEDLVAISVVYHCNEQRAEEISDLLTTEQLIAVKNQYAEISNVRESRR